MSETTRPRSLIELDPTVFSPAAISDRVYATLKHRILTCAMLPGQRVIEKELCTEMAISRTPLREALNRLALEGLVVLRPFRGYVIAPLTVADFRELCEFRRILESEAAALSALRATAEDIEELSARTTLEYTVGDQQTYPAYLRNNSAFHLALVRCTHNSQLISAVMSALDHHQRPLYLGLEVGIDAKASTAEHVEVVNAVRNHDPDRARALMLLHIGRAETRVVNALHAAGY
jgi:GntR family transcriptional regulator, rspAB operon transcriptional repressor